MDFENYNFLSNSNSHKKRNKIHVKISKIIRLKKKEKTQRSMQIGKSNARLEKESIINMLHDVDKDIILEQILTPSLFCDYGFHDAYSIQRDFAVIQDCKRNWELFLKRNHFSALPLSSSLIISKKHQIQFNNRVKKNELYYVNGHATLLNDNFDYEKASKQKYDFYNKYF